MVFTTDDYKKILKWLLDNSVKDTEFNEAVAPLSGREEVPIIQNGYNARIILKDLVDLISLLGVTDFINLTESFSKSYITLSEAILLVSFAARKIGQVITFLDDNKKWKIYQFLGYSLELWNNETLWIDVLKASSGGNIVDPDIPGGDIIVTGDLVPDNLDLVAVVEGGKPVVRFKDRIIELGSRVNKNKIHLRSPNSLELGDSIILSLKDVSQGNCTYLIRYKYNLLGNTLVIPENCILEFDGGSINNGKVIFGNTILYGDVVINADVEGVVGQSVIYLSWFGGYDSRINLVLNLGGFRDLVVDFDYSVSLFNVSIPHSKNLLFVNSTISIHENIDENNCLFYLELGSSINGLNTHIYSSVSGLIKFCSGCEISNINVQFDRVSNVPVIVLDGSQCELLLDVYIHDVNISGYKGPSFNGIYLNILGSQILIRGIKISNVICTPEKGSLVPALISTSCIYLYKDVSDSSPSTCTIRDCVFEENYVHSLLGEVVTSDSLGIVIAKGGLDVVLNFYSTNILVDSCKFVNCFLSDVYLLGMNATITNCTSINRIIPNHSVIRGFGRKISILGSSISTIGCLIIGDVEDVIIDNIRYSSTSDNPFISGALLKNIRVGNSDIICSGAVLDYNYSILDFCFLGCTIELTSGFDVSSTLYSGDPVIFNDCDIYIKFSQQTESPFPVKKAQFHHCDFLIYNAYKSLGSLYIFKLLPASNLKFSSSTFTIYGLDSINIIYGEDTNISADSIHILDVKVSNNGTNTVSMIWSKSHITSITIDSSNFSEVSLIDYYSDLNYLTMVLLKDIVLRAGDVISIKAKSLLIMYANNISSAAVEDFMKLPPIIDIRESNITNVRLNRIYGGVLADSYSNVSSSLDGGVFYFKERNYPVTLSSIRDHITISDRADYNRNIDGTDSNKIVIV